MPAVGEPARILFILLACSAAVQVAGKCDWRPEDATKPRSPLGDKFRIVVSDYNKTKQVGTYELNAKYLVSLQGDKSGKLTQKFSRFLLAAENKNYESGEIGFFEIEDPSFAKFSERCPNAVVEASKIPKEDVTVTWTSPAEDAGCISIRATVVESRDTWYMDEDGLRATLCPFSAAEVDDPGPVLQTCCACAEAKYEVTFEGLWSRNTHPKDFPSNGWLTRFSDVIGASHTVDYRFWEYAGYASEGLRQVAERGATRMLESELKDESEHIRTIIKARGISYPNVTGKTFAVFRVDRKHHLMSLVSMIDPSPDWIVGVSGLELCLSNCSWMEHRELNLYPYDAGTDSGITYISANSPTSPQEQIRRITSTFPNDAKSPFFDETGTDMKPIAKLYLSRQRLYAKTCDNPPPEDPRAEACEVSSWGIWGECSRSCGRGQKLRQRYYLDRDAASVANCKEKLTGRSKCKVISCSGQPTGPGITPEMCELDEWTSWSSCTTTCGPATKTRSRKPRNRKYRKRCLLNVDKSELQQTIECDDKEPCPGEGPGMEEVSETTEIPERGITAIAAWSEEWLQVTGFMPGDVTVGYDRSSAHAQQGEGVWVHFAPASSENRLKCPKERFTEWSMWSPCSSSCGPGVRLRSRLVHESWNHLNDEKERDLEECRTEHAPCKAAIPTCDIPEEIAQSICSEPQAVGNCNGNILRVYFDSANNQCQWFSFTGCGGNRNNFPTEQDCDNVCNKYQIEQTEAPDLGGIPSGSQVIEVTEKYFNEPVNCKVTKWSKWSTCGAACKGYSYRNRTILRKAENGGKRCPTKLQRKRKCRKLAPCSSRIRDIRRRSYNELFNEPIENSTLADCEVSSWSTWSPCTASCGSSVRHRTRNIVLAPIGQDAELCPSLVQFVSCHSPACTESTGRQT